MAFAYKVVEVREKMMGGKMSGEKLERLLNDHVVGRQGSFGTGWRRGPVGDVRAADAIGR